MSLYRKYRPTNFSELVGQEHVSTTLLNALKLDRVSHAYLFTGPRGTGKTSSARLLAKAINCLNPSENGEPCNECEICKEINDGRLMDLVEIDAASNRSIDEMRDLKEKINFAPTRAKSKVYIIDEVHMLTKEAFNALLKTLEEPPNHVYFILATTEVHKIPETILSRCQRFDFKRIDDATVISRLEYIASVEKIDVDDGVLELIAGQSDGCLRDAIGLFEKLIHNEKIEYKRATSILGLSDLDEMKSLFKFILEKNAVESLKVVSDVYSNGTDLTVFNKRFLEFLRAEMLKSVNAGDNKLTALILNVIDIFQKAYEDSKLAVIIQLPLEIACVKACLIGEENYSMQNKQNADVSKRKLNSSSVNNSVKPVKDVNQSKNDNATSIGNVERVAGGLKSDVIDFDVIKKSWNGFVEKVQPASAKMALKQGKLLRLDGASLVIGFNTKFYLDKVTDTDNRIAIESFFNEFFHSSVKIVGEIVDGPISNDVVHTVTETDKSQDDSNDGLSNLENSVLEVFNDVA